MKKIVMIVVLSSVFIFLFLLNKTQSMNYQTEMAVKEITSPIRKSHFNKIDREPRVIMGRDMERISDFLECNNVVARYNF